MVSESRNSVYGGYSILVGVEPNDARRWGQGGGRETDRWQVYQKHDTCSRLFSVRTPTARGWQLGHLTCSLLGHRRPPQRFVDRYCGAESPGQINIAFPRFRLVRRNAGGIPSPFLNR